MIQWIKNTLPRTDDRFLSVMSEAEVCRAADFHATLGAYAPTPLVSLPKMAEYLGVRGVFVKDESFRFGLNAFKALGGTYAISRHTEGREGEKFTFFTATDGNHGRGVAWAAQNLGHKCVVYMPKGSTETRRKNIAMFGAEVSVLDCNYDDCVRLAAKRAAETPNGVIIQDTAWDGYEDIPAWIMQGYGTMAKEARDQLLTLGQTPTHIFVQAGVGSLAGAVTGYFANVMEKPPVFVIVEAVATACLYAGAIAGDGGIRAVGGDLETIMAGLACGEPNTIAWDILKNHASLFVAASDSAAALGMRMLAAPIKGDTAICSGESGAAAFGALVSGGEEFRADAGLDENSVILLFSTEGDTDPDRYKNIVWKGLDR